MKLPNSIFGINTKEAQKRFEESVKKVKPAKAKKERKGKPLDTNVDKSTFVYIPQKDVYIGKREILYGEKWKETHYKLDEKGFFMPRIDVLMTHFMNVKEAAEGGRELYDRNGNSLQREESRELWDYLSSTNRNQFGKIGKDKWCWTWLDALFKKDKSGLYMITNHRVTMDGSGEKQLQGEKVPLDSYLKKDRVYTSLSFNDQGLPTTESSLTNYSQGENIRYWHPVKNRVAGFVADSDRAGLGCLRGPSDRDGSLGVFPCAEGTRAKNTAGGTK